VARSGEELSPLPLLRWLQRQRSLGCGVNLVALVEQREVFDLQPGFDEISIVRAAGMPRLPAGIAKEAGARVDQVDDLPEGL
jgi:hypothetical protein